MPSNKLNEWLLQDADDIGPDGDNVTNRTRRDTLPAPLPLVDASAVAADCCKIIGSRMDAGESYKYFIENIICIEFASDNSFPMGGLAYNIVIPVPPKAAFPRELLPSVHETLNAIRTLSNNSLMTAIHDSILQSMLLINHNHMLLQGNYKNTTTTCADKRSRQHSVCGNPTSSAPRKDMRQPSQQRPGSCGALPGV
ncbi:uncharacterized protein LOC142814455 [Rhipicephalus microplus]|uniref:uncharacterized protein LOC142814455 n=1 Tax=Rhipicephalus microplus TaxID=6941 RepID=UPI003F6A53B4